MKKELVKFEDLQEGDEISYIRDNSPTRIVTNVKPEEIKVNYTVIGKILTIRKGTEPYFWKYGVASFIPYIEDTNNLRLLQQSPELMPYHEKPTRVVTKRLTYFQNLKKGDEISLIPGNSITYVVVEDATTVVNLLDIKTNKIVAMYMEDVTIAPELHYPTFWKYEDL